MFPGLSEEMREQGQVSVKGAVKSHSKPLQDISVNIQVSKGGRS